MFKWNFIAFVIINSLFSSYLIAQESTEPSDNVCINNVSDEYEVFYHWSETQYNAEPLAYGGYTEETFQHHRENVYHLEQEGLYVSRNLLDWANGARDDVIEIWVRKDYLKEQAKKDKKDIYGFPRTTINPSNWVIKDYSHIVVRPFMAVNCSDDQLLEVARGIKTKLKLNGNFASQLVERRKNHFIKVKTDQGRTFCFERSERGTFIYEHEKYRKIEMAFCPQKIALKEVHGTDQDIRKEEQVAHFDKESQIDARDNFKLLQRCHEHLPKVTTLVLSDLSKIISDIEVTGDASLTDKELHNQAQSFKDLFMRWDIFQANRLSILDIKFDRQVQILREKFDSEFQHTLSQRKSMLNVALQSQIAELKKRTQLDSKHKNYLSPERFDVERKKKEKIVEEEIELMEKRHQKDMDRKIKRERDKFYASLNDKKMNILKTFFKKDGLNYLKYGSYDDKIHHLKQASLLLEEASQQVQESIQMKVHDDQDDIRVIRHMRTMESKAERVFVDFINDKNVKVFRKELSREQADQRIKDYYQSLMINLKSELKRIKRTLSSD